MKRAALLAGALAILAPAAVSADSFNPITVRVRVRAVARLHKPLKIRVRVSADPGVLDARSGPIRIRVKLANTECGGTFAYTKGPVLLNKRLKPQPRVGRAYSGRAKGKGRPTETGTHPLCIYLMDDYKQFATDTTDYQVTVRK